MIYKVYEIVTTNRKQVLIDNSYVFHILETCYREYIGKYLKSDSYMQDCKNA